METMESGEKKMEEKELIQYVLAAEKKDNVAMEILYKQFYRDVIFICRNFKLNEEDCKDIAQDTFIKAFAGLSTLQDKSKFKRWLLRIANNKCLDLLRHNNVLDIDSIYADDEILELPDKTKATDEMLIEKETEQILMSIIEKLPIEQRVTVFLFFYQDYSVKEIAALYGCTESTVRSRLNYAKKFMQKEIEKLDSKETKLRCIAILPFLYVLFSNQREALACEIPNALNVISQIMVNGVELSNVPATGMDNVLTAVTSTGKAVAFKMSIGKIFAIIALAVVVVGGGIGAAVYFSTSNQEETSTNQNDNGNGDNENEGSNNGDNKDDENDNGNNDDKGNESGKVDAEVAETIKNCKETLKNIGIFDVHSTFGYLFGMDDMYIDAKNMIFEFVDGDDEWYIEKEADGKVYLYECVSNETTNRTSIMSKRELSKEEIEQLDYVTAMTLLLESFNNEKTKIMTNKNGYKYLSCNIDLSILDSLAKYYRFDMIFEYTISDKNVRINLYELTSNLNIFFDEEYRITDIVIDSEKLESDFMDTLTDNQKETMVVQFKLALDFSYNHDEHEAPYVSDEVKQFAIPYTISMPYDDEAPRYMCNVDCGWEGDVDVYEYEIYGTKNGFETAVFCGDAQRFEERNEKITREEIEKAIKGSGGYSSVFREVDSHDIESFQWTEINGMDVGICHTECQVENNYTTIVAIKVNHGAEESVIFMQVTDRASVTYEADDSTSEKRKEVVLEVLDAMKIISVDKIVKDREKEWY